MSVAAHVCRIWLCASDASFDLNITIYYPTSSGATSAELFFPFFLDDLALVL